jgi:hypothetical protein
MLSLLDSGRISHPSCVRFYFSYQGPRFLQTGPRLRSFKCAAAERTTAPPFMLPPFTRSRDLKGEPSPRQGISGLTGGQPAIGYADA